MNQILTSLDQLDPQSDDFREGLRVVMNAVGLLPKAERPYAGIFQFMEEHPDADFGSPGPIVHTMEKLGGYEDALVQSLGRKPIPLTVWMVNRILNDDLAPSERERWLDVLRGVAENPNASDEARAEAMDFLEQLPESR